MEIEKGDLGNGESYIAFDVNGGKDRLAIAECKSQLRFAIRTESDNRAFTYLSRETIQTLLPYLQSFAEAGTLELRESPLQGDYIGDTQIAHSGLIQDPKSRVEKLLEMFQVQEKRIDTLEKEKRACFSQIDNLIDENADLEEQLTTMQEAGVAMASNIEDHGKRIEALQELVREWRHYYQIDALDDNSEYYAKRHKIFKRTAQLLGEEPQS